MKIKHGLLIFAIGAAVHGGAIAADKKDTNLQNQAESFKADQDTVSRDKLVSEGREITDARSAIRNDEYFDSLKQSAAQTKTGRINTQLDLERNEFILNNVPVHIRVAGEQEVQAYVRKHFIDNEDPTNNSAAVEAKTLWKNTDSSLTAPASTDYGWQPVVREVSNTAQVVNKDPEPIKQEPVELDNDDDTESDESKAPLELTAEDLARLFDNGSTNQQPNMLPDADTEKNVVINTITVNRVIIAPKAQIADIEVNFTVVHPGGSKKVDKTFKQVSPGHLFEVDGVRFEIAALTRHSIVLTNVETDKSYSQIID
ncbi:MAG: hypothetical protein CL840_03520 [Crocinitomicaceae bacterium]|nr:hypothetical protein [Crocinitomicaceae bacterium]|tara:strand:- start:308658 stop:309599 length:942 start_codon:yes stop_codon:yes gene_type:complete